MKIPASPVLLLALGSMMLSTILPSQQRGAALANECAVVKQTISTPAVVPAVPACSTAVPIKVAVPVATTVPVATIAPVSATTADDTIYTKISDGVQTRVRPFPAMAAPLDSIKVQIANRMNSGILSGQLTDTEWDEVRAALDNLSLKENNLKLTYGGINDLIVANMLPKYHMVNQRLSDLLTNTATNDYMPNPENRRASLETVIKYHTAAGNLTLGEGDQLLTALNGLSDEFAAFRATGDTVSADELEQLHKDLFKINRKLNERLAAPLARVVPEVVVHENELLATIERGIASHAFTATEGACFIKEYNNLVILGRAIGGDDGIYSPEMHELIAKIDNLNFVLDRQIHDRTIAGISSRY